MKRVLCSIGFHNYRQSVNFYTPLDYQLSYEGFECVRCCNRKIKEYWECNDDGSRRHWLSVSSTREALDWLNKREIPHV